MAKNKVRASIGGDKRCYCFTCERSFHSLGIARHRAAHRDKKENCRIQYTNGRILKYTFRKAKPIAKILQEYNSPG